MRLTNCISNIFLNNQLYIALDISKEEQSWHRYGDQSAAWANDPIPQAAHHLRTRTGPLQEENVQIYLNYVILNLSQKIIKPSLKNLK